MQYLFHWKLTIKVGPTSLSKTRHEAYHDSEQVRTNTCITRTFTNDLRQKYIISLPTVDSKALARSSTFHSLCDFGDGIRRRLNKARRKHPLCALP